MDDKIIIRRTQAVFKVCILCTRCLFSISLCPPAIYRALQRTLPSSFDLIARKNRAVNTFEPSGISSLITTLNVLRLRRSRSSSAMTLSILGSFALGSSLCMISVRLHSSSSTFSICNGLSSTVFWSDLNGAMASYSRLMKCDATLYLACASCSSPI